MKKTYIAPSLTVVEMEEDALMSQSIIRVDEDETLGGDWRVSRGRRGAADFDEEFDEEF